MDDLKIDYIELACGNIPASKAFFAQAFGWGFLDYGPGYQAFDGAGIDGGLDGASEIAVGSALVIVKAADLEAALARVEAAGGVVTKPIFGFPGGRRFEFREPGGAVMGVWSEQ